MIFENPGLDGGRGRGSELQFHPLADIFPLLSGEEFAALVEDIRTNGLREPIMLFEGMILDGRNRHRACLEADVEPTLEFFDGADPLGYVISLNLRRRHLDESQRAMVAARLATLRVGSNQHAQICAPSQKTAAGMLNVSRRSVQHAREVLDGGVPELSAAVDRGSISVSAASGIAQIPKDEQREIVARGEQEILLAAREINARKWEERRATAVARTNSVEFNARELGKYAVIYADPPWRYENPPIGSPSRRIENHYPTMLLQEICKLPVGDIAHDDSVLFLWSTAPKLAESMEVIQAWGFEYRTQMVWAKDKIGMGYYARNQHENLLICKRGEMPHPPESARPSSLIEAPRLEHSAKPDVFYNIIDAMYPGVRKIELFNRGGLDRDGWWVWGDQAEGVS